MLNRWIYKLEYKYGRNSLENLMLYIVIGMAAVFVGDLIMPHVNLAEVIRFDRALIFRGQLWRLVSFLLAPPESSLIFIVFSLYFYYFIGTTLERAWGSFKFNLYYLIGVLCTIAAGLITGYGYNTYLNFSLFFAFATLFPEQQVLLFFVIPIKVKWLGIADAVWFFVMFLLGGWSVKIAILFSVVNYLLFLGEDLFKGIRRSINMMKNRRRYRNFR